MPSPTPSNTGVLGLWAVTNTPGNQGMIRVEIYYNPVPAAVVDADFVNQPLRNVNLRALRVWNTCPNETVVTVVDQTNGNDVTVTVPSGDDVTPVIQRSASQLAAWGFDTRADVHLSISVR